MKLIKLSDSSAIQVGIIQMGKNVKGEAKKEKYLSIRKMYKTKKDKDWQVGYQGITLPLTDLGKKVIKAIITIYKSRDEEEVQVIEPKERKGKK